MAKPTVIMDVHVAGWFTVLLRAAALPLRILVACRLMSKDRALRILDYIGDRLIDRAMKMR